MVQTFDTIVFDQEITSDPRARSDFHGHYTMWLDPKAGLWLKSDLHVVSGSTNILSAGVSGSRDHVALTDGDRPPYSAAIATGAGCDHAASNAARRTSAFARFASFTGPKPLI